MTLSILIVVEDRKEVWVAFTLGELLTPTPAPMVFWFLWIFKSFFFHLLVISLLIRLDGKLLNQHVRYVPNRSIILRSYFTKRAPISFLISSCVIKSTGHHFVIWDQSVSWKNLMLSHNWIICSEFDRIIYAQSIITDDYTIC